MSRLIFQSEAAQYILHPIEEIYLDFRDEGSIPGQQRNAGCMLVATRKENVDTRKPRSRMRAWIPSIVGYRGLQCLENLIPSADGGLPKTGGGGRLNLDKPQPKVWSR